MKPLPACPKCNTVPEACSFCGELARHMMDGNVDINGAGLRRGPFVFAAVALNVLEPMSLKEVHGFLVKDRRGHDVATCDTADQAQFLVDHLNARRGAATIYFCDRHRHELLSEQLQDGEADVELGAYCPNTDCRACDTW